MSADVVFSGFRSLSLRFDTAGVYGHGRSGRLSDAVAEHRDTSSFGQHTFGAQPGQLLGGKVRRGGAVGAQYPVPGQVVTVLGEDPAHQPGPAR